MRDRRPACGPAGRAPRTPVRVSAAIYLALGAAGSMVALSGDYPAAPFGVDLGPAGAAGVLIGLGSAVSAPWPMLAALAVSAFGGRGPGALVPVLGSLFLVGGLAEPVFWDAAAGALGAGLATLVWCNAIAPVILLAAVAVPPRRSRRNDAVTPQWSASMTEEDA